MMASPSVLLPEPFGPIRACVSPRLIVRFTPCRIGLPSTDTCRFVIFSVSVISLQCRSDCNDLSLRNSRDATLADLSQ